MKKELNTSPVTLEEMLLCRERRAEKQKDLLCRFSSTVISFTMNIPGPVKNSPSIQRAFFFGWKELFCSLPQDCILFSEYITEKTGCEGILAVDLSGEAAKKICQAMEEETALGRLFDLDVILKSGEKLSRREERGCIVCGKQGRACSASRAHSVSQLWKKVQNILSCHFSASDAEAIASLAVKALEDEVLTTPKPGLVDRRNTGSHKDMTLSMFLDSAKALKDYFLSAVTVGMETPSLPPHETFLLLRKKGLAAEEMMYRVTKGVNTHKGAIYSLGVLCGAAGRLWTAEKPIAPLAAILKEAKKLTETSVKEDFRTSDLSTAGTKLYRSLGITGIRGEVASGFPSVSHCALPVLEKLLQEGKSQEEAGRTALIHLIATVEDTTLYHRGGKEGADFAKKAAKDLLLASPFPREEALAELDDAFIQKNLSPGGCADLLAVSYFLNSLKQFS